MLLPKQVTVIEVGPRDGLQNICEFINTGQKIELINALCETGLKRLEVTSFVHPKAVPQMKDAAVVLGRIQKCRGIRYCVLVPNAVGAKLALEAGASEINMVVSASESHNWANVKRTIDQSLEEFDRVNNLCLEHEGVWLRATIATAFGCPFEGKVDLSRIMEIIGRLIRSGVREIVLADTTGMGNPVQVKYVIEEFYKTFVDIELAVHFHNTRGNGIVNTWSAMLAGVTTIETSIGGLGGCPFVPDATGNVATEDVVNLMDDMGVKTGINLERLIDCARMAQGFVKTVLSGHVLKAGSTFKLQPLDYNLLV